MQIENDNKYRNSTINIRQRGIKKMTDGQIINLLTTGAAIVTIFSGINGFLGDKYIKASKKIFHLSILLLSFVFIKEIICLFNYSSLVISLLSSVFVIALYINYRTNYKLNKSLKITLAIIILVFWMLLFQKYLIGINISEFHIQLDTYIQNLNNLIRIVDVYQFMFSNENIIYTFSCILNIVIVCLNFYLLFKLNEYIEDDNEPRLAKSLCYAVALLILSCGSGVFLMNVIIQKF